MAQWLRLYTSKKAEGMGLISGQEIQILFFFSFSIYFY